MSKAFFVWLNQFCESLEATPVSQTIQTVLWIIPTIQIVHILAIAAVAGSALMINARLLGLLDRDLPMRDVARRFLPVIWWALPVLLTTGLLMIVGEPARSLKNPIFQTKVALILLAIAHIAVFQARLARTPEGFDATHGGRLRAILFALSSLTIWIAIIFAGRWIAYY